MSRVTTSQSNTAGPTGPTTDCRRWPRTLFAVGWRSSRPLAALFQAWPPKRRHPAFRSSSVLARTTVKLGLVTSINRPGGNATGVYIFLSEMDAKRMELLRELVRNPALIAVLLNPTFARLEATSKQIAEVARAAGQRIAVIEASNER